MKFLTDLGIARRTAASLRQLGHDVVEIRDLNLPGLPDSDILARAKGEGRIVLACDLDFGDLLAASGGDLPSVVLFRHQHQTPEGTLPRLLQVLNECGQELASGAIVSVEDAGYRLRRLPIRGSND